MTKDPEWGDDTVWVLGFKNGGDVKYFNVIVKYNEPTMKCTEKDWPLPAKQEAFNQSKPSGLLISGELTPMVKSH
jgi:hypothetical protein